MAYHPDDRQTAGTAAFCPGGIFALHFNNPDSFRVRKHDMAKAANRERQPMKRQYAQEKVSIIMPTYNCGRYIGEAVRSVQAQTYDNWELWIVDDCSTDGTAQAVRPFLEDPGVHYHCMEANEGPAQARNLALRRADGRYVAFLDSDDLWYPDKLEKQIAFMQSRLAEGCRFSCTAYIRIDEQGNSLHRTLIPPAKTGYWKLFFLSNPIGKSTVLFDRDYFGLVQAPLVRKRNDFGLWLEMLRQGDVCYGMEETLMKCRVREGSVSHNKFGLIRHQWHLYRHVEKMSLPLCAIGMACWAFVKGTGVGLTIRRSE